MSQFLETLHPSTTPSSTYSTTFSRTPSFKTYDSVIQRLETDDQVDHESLSNLMLAYFNKIPSTNLRLMMRDILTIAESPLCCVHDLDATDKSQDFSGSLLQCVLHHQV